MSRERILVIDFRVPTPDRDSGSVRMRALLGVLRESGRAVTFAPAVRDVTGAAVAGLEAIGVEVLADAAGPSAMDHLREHGRSYDLVVVCRAPIAEKYFAAVEQYAPQALKVFDTVDLHYLREFRGARATGKGALLRQSLHTKRVELDVVARADLTLVVSPAEKEILAREVPSARVALLSNIHSVQPLVRPFAERDGLLFVGNFTHLPNVDAVTYFAGNVMPLVVAELPEVKLHVVGPDAPEEVRALASEHVLVEGFAPDLAPFLNGSRLSVAPLRYGAGVKGKVNASLAAGLPVVATSVAVEGMGISDGEHALVADQPEEMAAAVIRLYRDEDLWARMSENGQLLIESRFSPAVARAQWEEALNVLAAVSQSS